MTKDRRADTFEDAIAKFIGTYGRERAGEIVDRTPTTVYNWGDPDGTHRPTLKHALLIDVAMQRDGHAPPIFEAYRAQLEAARERRPVAAPKDPRERLAAIMVEVGQVADVVRRVFADGRFSAAERAELLREAKDARDELDALLREHVAAPAAQLVRGAAE